MSNNKNKYSAIDFSYLLGGKVVGIDDSLMKIHFKLYEALVDGTNESIKLLNSSKNIVEIAGLQKNFSFFFNAMRLHELYFGVMAGKNMDKINDQLLNNIIKSFGSFKKWQDNFMNLGNIPGVGFVVLIRDKQTGLLYNN